MSPWRFALFGACALSAMVGVVTFLLISNKLVAAGATILYGLAIGVVVGRASGGRR